MLNCAAGSPQHRTAAQPAPKRGVPAPHASPATYAIAALARLALLTSPGASAPCPGAAAPPAPPLYYRGCVRVCVALPLSRLIVTMIIMMNHFLTDDASSRNKMPRRPAWQACGSGHRWVFGNGAGRGSALWATSMVLSPARHSTGGRCEWLELSPVAPRGSGHAGCH
eukprot:scaffold1183_cov418-Prasinococcus_capsulatus_cf.AAC.13